MPRVDLSFTSFEDAARVPNVVVDGSATTGTVLALSHWPGSPEVPDDLQADLSAQMAFRYLDHPESLHGAATVCSNNHFDQDGLVGVFALVDPTEALSRRTLLEDVAAAGDFGTYRFREAARASMVVSAFTSPERSPFAPLPPSYDEQTALLYTEALPRLAELVDDVDRYRHLWADEDAALSASEAAVANGGVRIDEHPEVDLAVVTRTGDHGWSGHRFGGRRYDGVHPMAVHNATTCSSLLLVADGSYRFTYRYEGWVKYRSRPIPRRTDLGPLAEALAAADDVPWSADRVGELTPELRPVDGAGSSLAPDVVTSMVVDHLRTAPPAFDPFRIEA